MSQVKIISLTICYREYWHTILSICHIATLLTIPLICLLFPVYLREALQQGAYREYRRFMRNDANIRGTIDVPRHLRYNTPFQGNVAYSVRDHTPDNMIMHLIRHTIEYLKSQKLGAAILNADKDIIMDVQQVYRLTETYKKSERQMVIRHNLRPFRHPYYTRYLPLQQLCLQILRNESMMYASGRNELSGILIDGSWLWEEYVGPGISLFLPIFSMTKGWQNSLWVIWVTSHTPRNSRL